MAASIAVPTTTTTTTEHTMSIPHIEPSNGGVLLEACLSEWGPGDGGPRSTSHYDEDARPMVGKVLSTGGGVRWLRIGQVVAFRPHMGIEVLAGRVLVDQRAILATLPGFCVNGCTTKNATLPADTPNAFACSECPR